MHDPSPHTVVYALYGPADYQQLEVWNRTWLQGKYYVFVPDAPVGPWASLYKPLPSNREAAAYRYRTDANMVWAVHAANRTYPNARWILACDGDTFLFEGTIQARAQHYDWHQPVAIGLPVDDLMQDDTKHHVRDARPCSALPRCSRHNAEGNVMTTDLRDEAKKNDSCCTCPVRHVGHGVWKLSGNSGKAFYQAPFGFLYGGTGILLSRGLLDLMSSHDWRRCAQRLVCGSADWRLSTCIAVSAATKIWDTRVHWSHLAAERRGGLCLREHRTSLRRCNSCAWMRMNTFLTKCSTTVGTKLMTFHRSQCGWMRRSLAASSDIFAKAGRRERGPVLGLSTRSPYRVRCTYTMRVATA